MVAGLKPSVGWRVRPTHARPRLVLKEDLRRHRRRSEASARPTEDPPGLAAALRVVCVP